MIAEIAEFKIPPDVLGAARVNLYVGFWRREESIDIVNIPVQMQYCRIMVFLENPIKTKII